jgi:hypothetical protein
MNAVRFAISQLSTQFRAIAAIIVAILCAAAGASAHTGKATGKKAAAPSAVVYVGNTGRVVASGSTTLHDWSLKSTQIKGTATLLVSGAPGKAAAELKALSLSIPVLSLKSGDTGMQHTAHHSLRHRHDPLIIYHLVSARLINAPGTKHPIYDFATSGNLTIAGKTRRVQLQLTLVPGAGGSLSISTAVKLKMTDFGISPPTAFFGIIRSANTVSVRAVWKLKLRGTPVRMAK